MPHSSTSDLLFAPAQLPSLPIVGSAQRFAVRRIFCVGRNYAEHAREMGDTGREAPFFFLKPADSLVSATHADAGNQRVDMPYPTLTQDLHHEVELVVAIGTGGINIAPEQAASHIFGWAVGLDMTRRDLQAQLKAQGRPWCIAKGFEASAPIAALTPHAEAPDLLGAGADIGLRINGQARQSGHTTQMIWSVAEVIAHLSQAWQLRAGDLIMTGTPAGVGAVVRGDVLDAHITGLPRLQVQVV